jgi:phosphoribosylformylglycinamidine (FGAM) synthase-like enzyme
MKKLMLLAAAGVGYVLGTKAGRERYEQIRSTFTKVKDDPRVQEKAQQAASFAADKAPVVKDKVAGAAGVAAAKVGVGSSDDKGGDLNPDRLKLGEDTGPQGNLP